MASYAERAGADVTAVLDGTGLTAADLRDPQAQVSARQELTVADNLIRAFPDEPDLGLLVGSRYRIATFGIFGYACITSPTLRDAVDFGLRYFDLTFMFCLPSVQEHDGSVTVVLAEPAVPDRLRRFLLLRDLASIHCWVGDLLGRRPPVLAVTWPFRAAGSLDHEALLGVRPVYDAAGTTATLDGSIMDEPLPQANELTVASAQEACRALLEQRRHRTGITHEVRQLLVGAGGPPPTIEEIARALSLSERTLRRRLSDAGTSYRELLAEVRQTLAEQMLATGALSVEDVAVRLGYAEASPFISAFQRWTGTTPARWARSRA